MEKIGGGPISSRDLFPSIHEQTFQNYRSEWMMSFSTPEAGKRFLDSVEKYNASIVRGPTSIDLPVFARPSLNAVYKRLFKAAKFPSGSSWWFFVPLILFALLVDGHFLLLLNVNTSPSALGKLRKRLQQVPFKVVRGSLEESVSRPVVLQMESQTDCVMMAALLDGYRMDDDPNGADEAVHDAKKSDAPVMRAMMMRV